MALSCAGRRCQRFENASNLALSKEKLVEKTHRMKKAPQKGGVILRKRCEKNSEKYYLGVKLLDKAVQPIRTHDFFHLPGHF